MLSERYPKTEWIRREFICSPFRYSLSPSRYSLSRFSLSLSSLTLVYFFLLSLPWTYVIADRFIETLLSAFKFFTWNQPQLSNSIYSLFDRPTWLSFPPSTLSLSLCQSLIIMQNRYSFAFIIFISLASPQHFPSFSFSRNRFSSFFSHHHTRLFFLFPLSFFLPLLSSSVIHSSLILSDVSFSPPFHFLPSSHPSWGIAKKSPLTYRVMQNNCIFPNHNLPLLSLIFILWTFSVFDGECLSGLPRNTMCTRFLWDITQRLINAVYSQPLGPLLSRAFGEQHPRRCRGRRRENSDQDLLSLTSSSIFWGRLGRLTRH